MSLYLFNYTIVAWYIIYAYFIGWKREHFSIEFRFRRPSESNTTFVLIFIQIYFILHKFRLVDLFTVFHNITILVVFLNSTLNPFIYAFWSNNFRSAIKTALCHCRRRRRGKKKVVNARLGPPDVNNRYTSYTITSSLHPIRDAGIDNNGQIISFNNIEHNSQNVTEGAATSHTTGEPQARIEEI